MTGEVIRIALPAFSPLFWSFVVGGVAVVLTGDMPLIGEDTADGQCLAFSNLGYENNDIVFHVLADEKPSFFRIFNAAGFCQMQGRIR